MSYPSDPSERSVEPSREADPDYAHYPRGWPPPDDEISLFDIWDALVRRRWLIIAVFVVVSVLAAGYAFTRPDVYRYRASLQIGYTSNETAEGIQQTPITTPAGAVTELNMAAVPQALREVLSLSEQELASGTVSVPQVQVESPSNTDIIHLTIEGSQDKAEQYRQILGEAASRLVNDHASALEAQRNSLNDRRDRFQQQEQRIASRIDDVEARIDRLTGTDGARASAIALRTDGLQQRLGSLQDRLLDIQSEREQVAADLATLDQYADAFTGSYTADSATRQREARVNLTAVGGGIQPTSIISAPNRSLTTVGNNSQLMLALGMVLGGMLGVFSAFVAEFVSAARRRHRELTAD